MSLILASSSVVSKPRSEDATASDDEVLADRPPEEVKNLTKDATVSDDEVLTDKPPEEVKELTKQPTPDQTDDNGKGSKKENSPPNQADTKGLKNPTEPLANCDAELRAAVKTASEIEAAFQRTKLENVALDTVRSTLATQKENPVTRESIFNDVLVEVNEGRKSKSGSDPTETEVAEIKKKIESHGDAIIKVFCDAIIKVLENDENNSKGGYTPQEKRKAVNRILKLDKQQATLYQLLGVEENDGTAKILRAYKQVAVKIHPDKNDDKAAGKCIKLVNDALELLRDPKKRKVYDTFRENNPPPKEVDDTFDEDFAPGAFDQGNDSDDDVMEDAKPDDEDDEDDEEADYPGPSRMVRDLHRKLGDQVIKGFFGNLDGPVKATELANALNRANKTILEDDKARNMPDINMFQVPLHIILTSQYWQRTIAINYELGKTKEEQVKQDIQALQNYFEKTRRRGLYQWPEAWTEFLLKPLRKRLHKLGLPTEYTETEPTLRKSAQPKPTRPKPQPQRPHPESTREKSTQGGSRNGATKDTAMPDAPRDDVYKELGILAHSSPRGGRVAMGYAGPKYFYDMEGPNKLSVKMAYNADDAKVMAYHNSNKTTDQMIDAFLVKSGTTPPWAMDDNDPRKPVSYLRLTYPLPSKRRNDQLVLRRRDDDDDDYGDGISDIRGV
ncbi:hypothetical protein DL764_005701 [Monosporascus ibericus]|uniref:J domain-containing protein n=1 Tax=Monosporascus ibericus TaxID=155417 RepID=A0A4V1XAG0_9PEZI|nr:hypothetical protein DL764_005701 [Monosporascus ibericus]